MPESSKIIVRNFKNFLHSLTPARLRSRQTGPKIMIISIPKSGTNVLKRCLSLFPMLWPSYRQFSMKFNRRKDGTELLQRIVNRTKKGQYSSGHIFYSEKNSKILEDANFKVLFIIRDPRDVVISHFHWVTELNTIHRLHKYYKNLPDNDARLIASIKGIPGKYADDGKEFEGIGVWFNRFMPWLEKPYTLFIKFEDIIGPLGGGDQKKQFETIKNIAEHLELEVEEQTLKFISENTYFKKARTFRKGTIGDWKNHFNSENKELFKEICGDWLIKMGYEKDKSW